MPEYLPKPDSVRLGWVSAQDIAYTHAVGFNEREWTIEEWDEFQQVCGIIPKFRPMLIAYKSVLTAWEHLMQAPAAYSAELSKAEHSLLIGGLHATIGLTILQSAFTSYLAARSAFLDRAAHFLSKNYGETSEAAQAFKRATNVEHLTQFSYRLYDYLRNHSQHRGIPISNLNIQGKADENGAVTINATIALDRMKLIAALTESGKKPKLRAELESLNDIQFEILDLSRNDHTSFQRLFLALFAIHHAEFEEALAYRDAIFRVVAEQRKKAAGDHPLPPEFTPMLVSINGDKGKSTLFMFDELEHILNLVAECEASRISPA